MSERDELATVIRTSNLHPRAGESALDSLRAADRILAAGYRKPRTIVTLAELESLPESSVVIDELETVAICIGRDLWTMGGDEYSGWELTSDWFTFPATVLYEPRA